MQLVKDARPLLSLTEVMKIARLTSPLLNAPHLSLPMLRHGRQLAFLFHPNQTPKLYSLFSALLLALLPCLPSLVISPTALLPGNWLRSIPLTCDCLQLSPSTATCPDKVAYPMLKHLPRSGIDFLLHIFNFFWTLHSFPFIWKISSIIPMHKMGKPLDSPAFFQPISLTSCISKLFECIILSCLLIFLKSNSILSPCQAGFCPERSTLDQILFLSCFILDGFNPFATELKFLMKKNFFCLNHF